MLAHMYLSKIALLADMYKLLNASEIAPKYHHCCENGFLR